MKLAIIGSRSIQEINIEKYLPSGVTEIVSGGARGVDKEAKKFALEHNIKYTEFLPDYSKYNKAAPLKRNEEIANYSDIALIFWDGASKGTKFTIKCFKALNKNAIIVQIPLEIQDKNFL